MADLYRGLDLARTNLTAFACVLSFELGELWPELSRRIDALSNAKFRLLEEHLRSRPARGLTDADLRAVDEAWGPLPLTGRFIRPLRRHLVLWLKMTSPKLARKVALLSDGGFERLCEQLQERRKDDA